MRFLKIVVACLFLSAGIFGTSQSAKFYTLTSPDEAVISKKCNAFVGVGRVQLPKYMDRPQIVVQNKDTPEMVVSEYNRWVEAPAVLTTRVLTNDLSTLLPKAQIKMRQNVTEKYDMFVTVEVVNMNAVLGEKAGVEAWFTIKDNAGKLLTRQKFSGEVKIGKNYDDLINGYSTLWMQLSQNIARQLVKRSSI